MLRSWFWILIVPAFLVSVPLSLAAEQDADDEGPWSFERKLTVSPQPIPMPALKYQLFPLASERKPGDAAPIYLRFAHERRDEARRALYEKPANWNNLPLDRLPLKEARTFLKGHAYNLKQLELGARRRSCDWNYTLDADPIYAILLPDAQEMRMHTGLLVLKTRVEMAEGKLVEAIHTLETGFGFSRHQAEAPFLINGLIAVNSANQFADALLDLVQRPEAPNLYWSLAVLPRPLIDLRKGLEFEQRVVELQFPTLANLDPSWTTEQWETVLRGVQEKQRELDRAIGKIEPMFRMPDLVSRVRDYPAAKQYLIDNLGQKAEKVEAMPAAQVLLLYLVSLYREIRDDYFKAVYLSYAEARPFLRAADKRLNGLPDTEAVRIIRTYLVSITRVMQLQGNLERKLAAVRVVEALRLHTAANKGELPDRLDQVTLVPVPNDPMSGRPFQYRRNGQTATLISLVPGEKSESSGVRYRVTLRK
jgi:hypothetical protein